MSRVRMVLSLVTAAGLLTSLSSTASAQGIFSGGGFFGGGGMRNINESRRQNNNNENYSNNNGYFEQPATYYAPVAPAPAPTSNVVANEIKPKRNDLVLLNDERTQAMSAALDARHEKEASQAGVKINVGIEQYLALGARGSGIANIAQAQQEWRGAVVSGDPNDFKKFHSSFWSKLAPEQRMWLDTRIQVLQYERDVSAGFLTQAGKDARLDQIQKSVAIWPTSPTKTSVQDSLNEVAKYNDLAKLVELSKITDNPFQVMFAGFQSAGFAAEDISALMGLPIMAMPAVEDSTVTVADILVMNPEDNGQPVNYSIASHPYSMKPGEKQSLTQSYVLSFDPGDGTALKRYTLTSGVYQFQLAPGAWDLSKVTPKIKIDNSRYHGTFNYLINGKEAALRPGQILEHTDSSAIVIEFDRGDGGSPARKVVATGTFVVGVDPAKQCLDVFGSNDTSPSTLLSVNSPSGKNSFVNDKQSREKKIEETLARLKAQAR